MGKTRDDVIETKDRVLVAGRPALYRTNNMVRTSKYTTLTFIPVAVSEQFRRFANLYFLCVGCIMAVGYYSNAFQSAINPWTTLGPLALVIAFSLMVEGAADSKRHRNDEETNNAPCCIIRRKEEFDAEEGAERDMTLANGKDISVNLNKAYYEGSAGKEPETPIVGSSESIAKVCFQKIRRMDIHQGHLIVVKNREMVPADMVLIASSSENGSSYIETSSIDGETNLKLRTSPRLPPSVLKHLKEGTPMDKMDSIGEGAEEEDDKPGNIETLEQATKRVARFSTVCFPDGVCALRSPDYIQRCKERGIVAIDDEAEENQNGGFFANLFQKSTTEASLEYTDKDAKIDKSTKYVAALKSEPPNPHVNTFTGALVLPPFVPGDNCHEIALGADNVLLRGAVVRNTEWAIGLVIFTGTDTKLVRNSFETPSKFSELDKLMNQTVALILVLMAICIVYLATQSVITTRDKFDELWYVGYKKDNTSEPWPYLPDSFGPPEWRESQQNWLQMFFLFVTLLNNLVPLSLYVTVEFITFCMLWLVYSDLDMYCDVTNTRAVARSTIITDLGRVQYIFSDKTGTLTQNVMRFKRCSVDGMMFGAPIAKSRPGAEGNQNTGSEFHPLRQLLVGNIKIEGKADGLEGLGGTGDVEIAADNILTLNAEMFLRVLSLCHTVVVEKDLDQNAQKENKKEITKPTSKIGGAVKSLFGSKNSRSNASERGRDVSESENGKSKVEEITPEKAVGKGPDGAPNGFAYQAESPDEGALVSAASRTFGFQVITRDSSGIKLRTNAPSILSEPKVVEGLKGGSKSLLGLAAETASKVDYSEGDGNLAAASGDERIETWEILAVNKFDSDRKRMSILLRSPPELGSLPILFCKGADSAMLDREVCTGLPAEEDDAVLVERAYRTYEGQPAEEWEVAQTLGLQAHLGDFASEGLRTLVLGMRILSENECEEWLEMYRNAATAMSNRDDRLTEAAKKIESGLYIVGATAIEDKLQVGVPDTIATLEKAGIKLWVLTGDKRETAVEIGYSTHVLTNKMHLTEVPDNGIEHVRAQMCMEFIRLVKMGKLPLYQHSLIDPDDSFSIESIRFAFGKYKRNISRSVRSLYYRIMFVLDIWRDWAESQLDEIDDEEIAEAQVLPARLRRKKVRNRADKVCRDWLEAHKKEEDRKEKHVAKHRANQGSQSVDAQSLASEELPRVFTRSNTARNVLSDLRSEGGLSQADRRNLQLAHLTASQSRSRVTDSRSEDLPLVDEDTLSLESFMPDNKATLRGDYDQRKRTLFERWFAVDRDVRKGMLKKHMTSDKLASIEEEEGVVHERPRTSATGEGPRALVIEGAALKHLLGDPELEELLFAVASHCEAVIACRVSPKQKALLVNLVRHNVSPEPVTLAIGDGANDVGMIQEAHVGVGISGKEGKQAVNASDFAIAQFRFLESLVLVHGRWDFFRLSVVVLFSFYKNAVMVGCIIVFSGQTVFSGTPLFDEWVISVLNFVCGFPIVMLGLFDRILSKQYVLKHPEVYNATRNNEPMSMRMRIRWIGLLFVHIFTIYYMSVLPHQEGGGYTSAFQGLMSNSDTIGDGEGGDLKSVGLVAFSNLVVLLGYKVLYESKSLIHGRWPSFGGEGFFSRVAYTWVGLIWLSYIFYMFFIAVYSILGRSGASSFSDFVDVGTHVFRTRTMTWLLCLFVPIVAIMFDVCGKVFSNMFFPTQTQIHLELESQHKADRRRYEREAGRAQNTNPR